MLLVRHAGPEEPAPYLIRGHPERVEDTIGVEVAHWFAPPLPPNRTCGSPASGSPVGGFTLQGLTNMLKEMPRVHSLRWKTEPDFCFPPYQGVINRNSFPRNSVLFHASEEKTPTGLAFRHSRRLLFCFSVGYPSTSLRSLRSGPITALPCYYGRSDSCPPGSSALSCMNTASVSRQVSLLHITQPSMHSVTKHLTRPATASPLPAQRDRLPGLFSRSGLHLESAGSSLRTAESCSSSYGLHVRFRLLPTPPHGDAVTFDYQERASPERGLSPLRSHLLAGARIPGQARNDNQGKGIFDAVRQLSTAIFQSSG